MRRFRGRGQVTTLSARVRRFALFAVALTLAIGCTGPSADVSPNATRSPSAGTTPTVASPTPVTSFAPTPTPPGAVDACLQEPSPPPSASSTPRSDAAFQEVLVRASGGDNPGSGNLNALWAAVMQGANVQDQREYVPPRCFISYETGQLPPNAATCAPTQGTRFWAQNAFYCAADNTILYDVAWFHDFYLKRGEFAPTAILAHEWGHHIQFLLGNTQTNIRNELMADCFAGMYVSWLEKNELGFTDPSAVEGSLAAFFDLGNVDYQQSEWFQSGEHGSRNQRMLAFMTGYLPIDNGLPWCYGYRDFDPTTNNVRLGRYDFVTIPGRPAAFSGSNYVIEPDLATGYVSSPIGILWAPNIQVGADGMTPEEFLAIMTQLLPNGVVLPETYTDLTRNLRQGSGAFIWYESGPAAQVDDFGIFGLASPADGAGALVFLISRDGSLGALDRTPTPDETVVLGEMTVAIYQVITRLCGPDQSGTLSGGPTDETWNAACTNDQ